MRTTLALDDDVLMQRVLWRQRGIAWAVISDLARKPALHCTQKQLSSALGCHCFLLKILGPLWTSSW